MIKTPLPLFRLIAGRALAHLDLAATLDWVALKASSEGNPTTLDVEMFAAVWRAIRDTPCKE